MLLFRTAGVQLLHLIALALNFDEDFFERVGALDPPNAFFRLIHYPGTNWVTLVNRDSSCGLFWVCLKLVQNTCAGELNSSDEEIYGASAHSDYGMITLLASDGVPGLQVCLLKQLDPQPPFLYCQYLCHIATVHRCAETKHSIQENGKTCQVLKGEFLMALRFYK